MAKIITNLSIRGGGGGVGASSQSVDRHKSRTGSSSGLLYESLQCSFPGVKDRSELSWKHLVSSTKQ